MELFRFIMIFHYLRIRGIHIHLVQVTGTWLLMLRPNKEQILQVMGNRIF